MVGTGCVEKMRDVEQIRKNRAGKLSLTPFELGMNRDRTGTRALIIELHSASILNLNPSVNEGAAFSHHRS